jgi:hypothetical protein
MNAITRNLSKMADKPTSEKAVHYTHNYQLFKEALAPWDECMS